jgi:hypothetical protein
MIGGWHWPGRSALAADWRILLPSPGRRGHPMVVAQMDPAMDENAARKVR